MSRRRRHTTDIEWLLLICVLSASGKSVLLRYILFCTHRSVLMYSTLLTWTAVGLRELAVNLHFSISNRFAQIIIMLSSFFSSVNIYISVLNVLSKAAFIITFIV